MRGRNGRQLSENLKEGDGAEMKLSHERRMRFHIESELSAENRKAAPMMEAARKRRVWWEPFRGCDARDRSAEQNAREVEILGRV
jgi:hypothetical protein